MKGIWTWLKSFSFIHEEPPKGSLLFYKLQLVTATVLSMFNVHIPFVEGVTLWYHVTKLGPAIWGTLSDRTMIWTMWLGSISSSSWQEGSLTWSQRTGPGPTSLRRLWTVISPSLHQLGQSLNGSLWMRNRWRQLRQGSILFLSLSTFFSALSIWQMSEICLNVWDCHI